MRKTEAKCGASICALIEGGRQSSEGRQTPDQGSAYTWVRCAKHLEASTALSK